MKEKYGTNKDIDSYMSRAHDAMFTQMSAKKGIKKFGKQSIVDMFKDYQQLNDGPMPGKSVFGRIHNEKLRSKDRKKILEAVNLIKEKLCGNTKGRKCANSSRQKSYLSEDEYVYSPT